MNVKAKVEAVIYATEEPVTLNQLASLLRDAVLAELRSEEEVRLALNKTVKDAQPDSTEKCSDEPVESSARELTTETAPDPRATPQGKVSEQAAMPGISAEQHKEKEEEREESRTIKAYLEQILDELTADYATGAHGVEVRQIAGGYRMGTKPEHHDVVVGFAKSLKPPIRLSLQALETLAVIAYKQPVTIPEISEIRGVDSSGVIATLLDRKLITTGGRKQVIGRPILYKTTKEFLLRFGLDNISELPSAEEFEKLGDPQTELFPGPDELGKVAVVASDSEGVEAVGESPEVSGAAAENAQPTSEPKDVTKNSQI